MSVAKVRLSAKQRGFMSPKKAARLLRESAEDLAKQTKLVKFSLQVWFTPNDGSCQQAGEETYERAE